MKIFYNQLSGNLRKHFNLKDFPTGSVEFIDFLGMLQSRDFCENEKFLFAKEIGKFLTTKEVISKIELEKLCEVFEIEDDDGLMRSNVFGSYEVKNSSIVVNSCYIADSTLIDRCLDVKNSSVVCLSQHIHNCEKVFNARDVLLSKSVADSESVMNSKQIYKSKNIKYSDYVCDCCEVKNSFGVFQCASCQEIYYSYSLTDCSYCMFCCGLTGKKFYIFNEPVEPRVWFVLMSLIKEAIPTDELTPFFEINSLDSEWCNITFKRTKGLFEKRYVFFKSLKEDTIRYLLTAPGADRNLLYQITLNEKFLLLGKNKL